MKTFLLLFAAGLLLPAAKADNAPALVRVSAGAVLPHSASLSWTLSPTVGASHNVYRAPCTGTVSAGVCSTEGAFVKLQTLAPLTKTYTDSTVAAGGKYAYYVAASCVAPACGNDATGAPIDGESAPSNHVGVSVPMDPVPPQPPSGLSLVSVAQSLTGANATLTASWTDDPGVSTTYSVWVAGRRILTSGVSVNDTGTYQKSWGFKVKPGTQIYFSVCDTNNVCQSKAAS